MQQTINCYWQQDTWGAGFWLFKFQKTRFFLHSWGVPRVRTTQYLVCKQPCFIALRVSMRLSRLLLEGALINTTATYWAYNPTVIHCKLYGTIQNLTRTFKAYSQCTYPTHVLSVLQVPTVDNFHPALTVRNPAKSMLTIEVSCNMCSQDQHITIHSVIQDTSEVGKL